MDVTIDTSTVYSTFYMDKLTKIYRHRWKENLKISNLAKFESDRIKTNKDMAPQSSTILWTFVWWGGGGVGGKFGPPTIQMPVKFRDFRSYIFALFFHITLKCGTFTNFKALFLAVAINSR